MTRAHGLKLKRLQPKSLYVPQGMTRAHGLKHAQAGANVIHAPQGMTRAHGLKQLFWSNSAASSRKA